jgi:hypothetical protein
MAIDAHAVRPELEHASGAGGPLGDSRSVQPSFLLLGIEMILHPQPIGDGARHRRCNKAQGGAAWRLERWRQQRPNRGYVSLSIDHDTAPLAVNATWRSAGS